MTPQAEAASERSDARAQRRWLIGLGITVVFGIFGAVMALLAYTNSATAQRSGGPAPTATPPAQTGSPAPDEPRGKGHGKDHGRN